MRKRALVSVSDKTGIVELCQFFVSQGVEIISTGGTAQVLSKSNIPYIPIEKITGNPEAFGGRMKTLSFQIESALLFRDDVKEDLEQAKKLGIERIHFLVCNLYPFDSVVRKSAAKSEWIENIDIGGPTMIRAGAKNYSAVTVLTHPSQYETFMKELNQLKGISLDSREKLAIQAFQLTSSYELRIASHLTQSLNPNLRYGENPHQKAVLLPLQNVTTTQSLTNSEIIQGKQLSYNNWLDSDQAYKLCSNLNHSILKKTQADTVCVIVKHGTPCGVARHPKAVNSIKLAIAADSVSAFGGIVALNQEVNAEMAHELTQLFLEVIIAPSFSDDALEIFKTKKNLRLLAVPLKEKNSSEWTVRSIHGGLLVQDEDEKTDDEIISVTKNNFPSELSDLSQFGLEVTRHLKSNCIGIFAKRNGGYVTLVSGVGQPNRLECITKLIKSRAEENNIDLTDGILVSDAFFPFKDSIEACHSLGIKYIIQPGGSIRDQEVIEACDQYQIAMAFTGQRHFRH